MTESISNDGLTIAPGVVETIVSIAVSEVDGVAQVGAPSLSNSFKSAFTRHNPAQGILITAEEGQFQVTAHVQVYYGYRLHDVADNIRAAVADTLAGQVGISVSRVDVFIDSVQFPE
ncbi:MAG: Asp23/Gls24 family envelope stress response protein [Coriobacteriales bacterium]|jgi:uncharacterized alkaline shock family protein YloU|nr:Asp23/Gls24 family envelope stress response protein [Coriobacteriales bacterium]